jgi:hypothetical protein
MHCEASPPHGSAGLFALRKPQSTLRRVRNIYYMDKNISSRIANFPHLSKAEPADFWQKLYRRPAPPGIRREVSIPFLAYIGFRRSITEGSSHLFESGFARLRGALRKIPHQVNCCFGRESSVESDFSASGGEATHEVSVTSSGYECGACGAQEFHPEGEMPAR